MTTQPDPARQERLARSLARRAIRDLAEDTRTPLTTRPAYRDGPMVRDLIPLAGAAAAREIELAAREHVRGYIRLARQAGHTWHEIGTALHLAPDSAQHASDTAAEAAFTYVAGDPGTEHARQYGRSVTWHCDLCDHEISDHGPADDERNHADNCISFTTTIATRTAEWEALEAEWEAGQ